MNPAGARTAAAHAAIPAVAVAAAAWGAGLVKCSRSPALLAARMPASRSSLVAIVPSTVVTASSPRLARVAAVVATAAAAVVAATAVVAAAPVAAAETVVVVAAVVAAAAATGATKP